jgi:hypothetical protein
MARYHHNIFGTSKTVRYLVIFDLQWKIIECQRLEPPVDLHCAMGATINRLLGQGWIPECEPKFGFVFLIRENIRRLLILTERDPADTTPQAFSPFK